jgi:L-ascorbate metabolism protein UlaG (beta-lactamase superfamily)
MTNTKYYLKQNVQMEPLFNQWYAWSHLIAPATAAMNIANSHLKIMKSYVAAPQVHANAVKNPAMLGGPFIDYEGGRVNEIRELMDRTSKENQHMLAFADSIKAVDELLRSEAKGYSLEPLYEKVPANLRGYVELVYDLNNNASMRFYEPLLYKSEFYNTGSQSVLFSIIEKDHRAFALSTPRLADDKSLQVHIPLNHPGLDDMFKMKHGPQTLGYISERLGLDAGAQEKFQLFLTEEEPPHTERYSGEDVRVRYFGHACVLLETKDVSMLLDPVLSYKYDNGIDRYTFLDLPDVIDYVLITHGHQDHVMFESLIQLRSKIRNIIVPRSGGGALQDPSMKLVLENIGFRNVIELGELETVEIPDGLITGLPFMGEHTDLNIQVKMAHHIRLKDQTFMFAADTNNIEPRLYEHIFRIMGDVDVMYLGMECDGAPLSWLYGQLLTKQIDRKMDQSRRLNGSNFEHAMALVSQFNCREVYVYAMGQEPWLNYVMSLKYTDESNPIVHSNKLMAACKEKGIISERLFGKKEFIYGARRQALVA